MEDRSAQNRMDPFAANASSITSGIITTFLVFATVMVSLFYDNSYFNILETKYKCFYLSALMMLGVLLVSGVILFFIDMKEFQGEHVQSLFSSLKPSSWKKTFGIVDAAVLVFWIAALISTLQSEYLYESFWGNEGRYSGLFLITLYVAVYFVVSRFWQPNRWTLQIFLIAGMIVCYIGITDYFQMDILHFRDHIKPEQSTIFTSTIGNINTYTAYVALVMGAAAAMFTTTEGRFRLIWYYFCMVVTFFAIIFGCSDNAYLALGALFVFLPLIAFRSRKGTVRYLVMVATFATVIQCIDYINQAYADTVIGLDSLFQVLVNLPGLMGITIALWAVAVIVFVLFGRGAEQKQNPVLRRVWIGILIAGFLGVCALLIDANALGHGSRYGSLGNYLVFNDSWGTNRGFIWKKSVELYRDFPFMHKLFGYGPDTFGIMTTQKLMGDMVQMTGQVFDNAHNEYLQFLLTIGPVGTLAYVVFIFGNCWKMERFCKNFQGDDSKAEAWKAVCAAGCLFAVLCYSFQAVVNLNLPIATPIMWLALGTGSAIIHREKCL